LPVPPLGAAEVQAALPRAPAGEVLAVLRGSFGWARYASVLAQRLAAGTPVAAAWEEEMAKGGRLELMCHHTYEALLLRSRGYGMAKAVLEAVASDEGLNLKALVARLGRTPGATRDYLQWLVGVDALLMEKKRYFFVDGLVRLWVRLHATGRPATPADLSQAAEGLFALAPPVTSAPEGERHEPPTSKAVTRSDTLMEID
jgi:hypothetical protein